MRSSQTTERTPGRDITTLCDNTEGCFLEPHQIWHCSKTWAMTCSYPWWYSVCVGLWVGFLSNFWEYYISHLKIFTITLISGTVSPKCRPVTFKICEYLVTQIVLLSLCECVSCDVLCNLSENGYVCSMAFVGLHLASFGATMCDPQMWHSE